MASLDGFDANAVEPAKGRGLIPKGTYPAVMVDSAKVATQAGDGHYMEYVFQILDGEYQNRKVWTKLNLWNKNADAVKIAKGDQSAICRAVGVMTPKDSAELHNKPLMISIAIKKEKNEIVGYKARNAGPDSSAPPATVGGKAAPW